MPANKGTKDHAFRDSHRAEELKRELHEENTYDNMDEDIISENAERGKPDILRSDHPDLSK